MRPYRDDDNDQTRRGWQRRWQDDSRTRRGYGHGEDRYPGDRWASSERERYGNPTERYSYDEPWRVPGPYRLRQSGGYDEEGYRTPSYDEGYEQSFDYRRPYSERGYQGSSSYGSSRYGSSGSGSSYGSGQSWGQGQGHGSSQQSERGYPGYTGWSERAYDRSESYDRSRDRGPYYGRGPKGYRRSDESIRETVNQRLEEHGMIDASEIEVTVKEGVVTLKGNIDTRESKRLAEDIVEGLPGVKDVENQLRVDQGFFDRLMGRSSSKNTQESSR